VYEEEFETLAVQFGQLKEEIDVKRESEKKMVGIIKRQER